MASEQTGFPVATRQGLTGPVHRFFHEAMATTFEVVIPGGDGEYARQAAAACFRELDRIQAELSRFEPGSDVWQVNALSAGQAVAVGDATLECLLLARRVFGATDGAFDATAGALMNCLRTDDGRPRRPTDEEFAAALGATGMDLLVIDAGQYAVGLLADGVCVDLGGVGKGHALDRMGGLLGDWDVETAFLSGGTSTVLAIGPPAPDDGWRLAVREPDGEADDTESIYLRNRAFSGSGTAVKGRHIVDPRTGRPPTGTTNAWAAAASAALSDALSTAFMVMTPEKVARYCRKHPDVGAMLLTDDRKLLCFGKWTKTGGARAGKSRPNQSDSN